MTDKELALCFKALGDETRLQIVKMLLDGEMCACKILEKFEISQPTLSYHMKTLCDCKVINVEKFGVWNHYSINEVVFREITHKFNLDNLPKNPSACYDNCCKNK